jgi:hypothetical protein
MKGELTMQRIQNNMGANMTHLQEIAGSELASVEGGIIPLVAYAILGLLAFGYGYGCGYAVAHDR